MCSPILRLAPFWPPEKPLIASVECGFGLCLLHSLCVGESGFSVSNKNSGMAHVAVLDSFFRVANGFCQVIFGKCEARREEDRNA